MNSLIRVWLDVCSATVELSKLEQLMLRKMHLEQYLSIFSTEERPWNESGLFILMNPGTYRYTVRFLHCITQVRVFVPTLPLDLAL